MFADKTTEVVLYGYDSQGVYQESFDYTWVVGTGLASNSTLVKPNPVESGMVNVWNGSAWESKVYHIGKVIYHTTTKQPKLVDKVGEIEQGYTLLVPKQYETWNGSAWEDQRSMQDKMNALMESLPTLDRRQFKLGLLNKGVLHQLEGALEAITDDVQKAELMIEYTESTTFKRTSEPVKQLFALIGMKEQDINDLWETASKL